LGDNQDELVSAVAAVQPNTTVVVHSPGAVVMPWESTVPAILCAFMPGQEDGNAIADVLFGVSEPAGRLPVTFPLTSSQTPFKSAKQYPGVNNQADYTEGLFVGYRYYDANHLTPLYPFGHGLSYTDFQYYNLRVTTSGNAGNSGNATVSFTVQNTGPVTGSDVPQLYLGFPAAANEPPKQLRGFTKVTLPPGRSTTVTIVVTAPHLSMWDIKTHKWVTVPGSYIVNVGASSRDIRLVGKFNY